MKRNHLSTKITANDHAKPFPNGLHESGGKLFCTPCNIVLGHKRKSTINIHFESTKHMRMSEQLQQQITMTELVTGKTVASIERLKESGVLLKHLLR